MQAIRHAGRCLERPAADRWQRFAVVSGLLVHPTADRWQRFAVVSGLRARKPRCRRAAAALPECR